MLIDKDYSAAKLVENIKADELVILTTVKNSYLNYGKKDQQSIKKVTVDQLKKYLAEEQQLAPGSYKTKD